MLGQEPPNPENDPAGWRTAVDPKSGRTYWYHKITRNTTWKMPECLAEGVKEDNHEEDPGYKELIRMLDGLASPSELIGLLDQPPEETQFEILKILFNCCLPTTAGGMSRIPQFIDKLVAVCTFTTSTDIRDLSLRLLFTLAAGSDSAAAFKRVSSWVPLCDHVIRWGDRNAGLMYSYFICLLSIHGAASAMPRAHLDKLLDFVLDHCDCPDAANSSDNKYNQTIVSEELHMFIPHPNPSGYNVLDAALLEMLLRAYQSSQGAGPRHLLSSVTFLRIIKHALRNEENAVYMCKCGAFSVLQSLCLDRAYPESIKDEATALLLITVNKSEYIRQLMVRSWLGMAADMSQLQRDFSPSNTTVSDIGLELEHAERSVKIRSTLGKAVVSFHPSVLWARCPGLRTVVEELWSYRKSTSQVSSLAEPPQAQNWDKVMDVAIEATDVALTALSTYIHTGILAPVPARKEMNSDASSSSSSSTGDLLEIVKVATELGMDDLTHLASRRVVQELYTPRPNDEQSLGEATMIEEQLAMQRIDDCMHFGEAHGLEILLNYLSELRRYMLAGQHSSDSKSTYSFTPITCTDRVSAEAHPISQKQQAGMPAAPSNFRRGAAEDEFYPGDDDQLHRQVAESLQEVSHMISRDNKDRPSVKPGQFSGVDVASSIDSSRSGQRSEIRRPATAAETRKPTTTTTAGAAAAAGGGSRPKTAQAGTPAQQRTASKAKASGSAAAKNKHGSMYELLLKNASGAEDAYLVDETVGEYDYDKQRLGSDDFDARASFEYTSDDQREFDDGSGRASTSAFVPSRAPGRLPSASQQPKGAVVNKGSAPVGAKPAPMSAAGRIAGTPKRPQNQPPSRGAAETSMYVDSDLFELDNGAEVTEFDPRRHSLEPTAKTSQSKNRLDALSQPKTYREPYDVRRKAREAAAAAEQLEDAEDGAEGGVGGSGGGMVAPVPSAPPRAVGTPKPTRAKTLSKEPPVEEPKPIQSSQEPRISAANVDHGAAGSSQEDPQVSVDRSEALASLKLLKMKTRGSILKRASVESQPSTMSTGSSGSFEVPTTAASSIQSRREDSSPEQNTQPVKPAARPRPVTRSAPVATPVAPSNCTRTSGCTCSLCSVPLDDLTSYGGNNDDDDNDRFADDSNTASRRYSTGALAEPARETELQRKRKEMNRQKAQADATPKPKSEKWRMQSMQFRAAISAARAVSNGEEPAPTPVFKDENGVPFGMVHCDGCGRNFNPESGARHMAVCRDIKGKPKMLLKGSAQRRVSTPASTSRR